MKIIVTKFKNIRVPKKNRAWTLVPNPDPITVTRECGLLAIEAGVATEYKAPARKKKKGDAAPTENPAPSPASAEPEGEASPES